MITIDKAIAQEKELFEHCKRLYEPLSDEDKSINPLLKNEIEYHKQLAEWLEELKEYKKKPEGWLRDEAEQKGYNKAIYDFTRILHHEEFDNAYGVNIVLTPQQVDEIAEQLKESEDNV